jgi:DNA mismatch endonuclease (patch repair protein)
MPDKFPPKVRSKIMSHIKGKDTAPEKLVRSFLHAQGFRFRLHRKDLPGKPDITIPKYKTVVLVHGCFWHQHPKKGCRYSRIPSSNLAYWEPKLARTVARDKRHQEELKALGWAVEVVWECEISQEGLEALAERIRQRG